MSDTTVIIDGDSATIVTQQDVITVLTEGVQGPPGQLTSEAGADINMMGFDVLNAGSVTFIGEYDNGSSGAAKTLSLANGTKQKITLTASTTLTIVSGGSGVGHYQIRLIQDSTGGHAVTFAGLSGSRWLGAASAPGVNAIANGESILSVYFDGANFIQSLAKVGSP